MHALGADDKGNPWPAPHRRRFECLTRVLWIRDLQARNVKLVSCPEFEAIALQVLPQSLDARGCAAAGC